MSVQGRPSNFFRRALVSSTIYGLALTIQRLASVLLLPVYTRYLSPADYGVLEVLDVSLQFVGIFCGLTLPWSLFYFYARGTNDTERNQVMSTAMLGTIPFAAVSGTALFVFSSAFSRIIFATARYGQYLRIAAGIMALSLLIEMGFACLRAMDKAVLFAAASLARVTLSASLIIYLLAWRHMGIEAFLWGNLSTSVLMTAGLCACLWSRASFVFRARLFLDYIRYAAPSVLVGVSYLILHNGDRYFLLRFASIAQVGVYSLAYKGGMLVAYADQAFTNFWGPEVYRVLARPDGMAIFSRTFTYFFLVLVSIGLALSLFAGPVVLVMTGPLFHAARTFVPWVVAVYTIRAAYDFFRNVQWVENRTVLDARICVTAGIVCLAGYAALIPRFGCWGAIAATALGFVTGLIHAARTAYRLRPFTLEWSRLWRIGAAALTIAAIMMPLETGRIAWQFTVAGAGILLFPIVLAATGFLRPGEIASLQHWLHGTSRVPLGGAPAADLAESIHETF